MDYKTIIVGIAGGTGSGKTSVTRAIIESLEKKGIKSILLEQDSYYKRNDHLTYEQRVTLNYDHPNAIDFDLLESHILALKNLFMIFKFIIELIQLNISIQQI